MARPDPTEPHGVANTAATTAATIGVNTAATIGVSTDVSTDVSTGTGTSAVSRPPSVDRLARSLSGSGLPHAICVDIARQAIADGHPDAAAAAADTFRRTLLTPVINATGVLLHTNLGRAPVAVTQAAHAQNVEFDLLTGER